MDGLDAVIEEMTKEAEAAEIAANAANANGKPAEEKPGEPATPAPDKPAKETEGTLAAPAEKTPKEILGTDDETWDSVKAKLSEIPNLRQELESAKSRPTVAFASEKIAAFNVFAEKTKIEDFAIFNRVVTADLTDPLQVLVTKFILDNPKFSGKEDLVTAKLSEKYKIDPAANPDDHEFNKIQMESDADVARTAITGLRESLKTAGTAPAPEDIAARETEMKGLMSKEILTMDKIAIPYMTDKKDDKGNPIWEKYIDFEVSKEFREQFVAAHHKEFAKIANAKSPETAKQIRREFIKEALYENYGAMTHAAITKAKADERLAVQAQYDGAGKLLEKDASPAAGEEDPYASQIWK